MKLDLNEYIARQPGVTRFYQDKKFIWSKVKHVKGTRIRLSHDYPREIEATHTKLYPVKNAKQGKQSVFFKADKLIINGQVFKGIETGNFLYYTV